MYIKIGVTLDIIDDKQWEEWKNEHVNPKPKQLYIAMHSGSTSSRIIQIVLISSKI